MGRAAKKKQFEKKKKGQQKRSFSKAQSRQATQQIKNKKKRLEQVMKPVDGRPSIIPYWRQKALMAQQVPVKHDETTEVEANMKLTSLHASQESNKDPRGEFEIPSSPRGETKPSLQPGGERNAVTPTLPRGIYSPIGPILDLANINDVNLDDEDFWSETSLETTYDFDLGSFSPILPEEINLEKLIDNMSEKSFSELLKLPVAPPAEPMLSTTKQEASEAEESSASKTVEGRDDKKASNKVPPIIIVPPKPKLRRSRKSKGKKPKEPSSAAAKANGEGKQFCHVQVRGEFMGWGKPVHIPEVTYSYKIGLTEKMQPIFTHLKKVFPITDRVYKLKIDGITIVPKDTPTYWGAKEGERYKANLLVFEVADENDDNDKRPVEWDTDSGAVPISGFFGNNPTIPAAAAAAGASADAVNDHASAEGASVPLRLRSAPDRLYSLKVDDDFVSMGSPWRPMSDPYMEFDSAAQMHAFGDYDEDEEGVFMVTHFH